MVATSVCSDMLNEEVWVQAPSPFSVLRLTRAITLDLSTTPPIMVTCQAPRADRYLISIAKNGIHCFCRFFANSAPIRGCYHEGHESFLHFVLKCTIKKLTGEASWILNVINGEDSQFKRFGNNL